MSTPPKGYRVISFGQADGLPKGWYWERTTKVSQTHTTDELRKQIEEQLPCPCIAKTEVLAKLALVDQMGELAWAARALAMALTNATSVSKGE
jgi:hypothetical protein